MADKRIPIADTRTLAMWRGELTKLRCWHTGYDMGRATPGSLQTGVPGDQVLRQIIMAIDDATKSP